MSKLGRALAAAIVVTAVPFGAAWAEMVAGEVRRVDPETGRITIRHEPIKSLDMEAMTMVFATQNAELAKSVKPGDKITFEVTSVNGQLTVTKIEKAK